MKGRFPGLIGIRIGVILMFVGVASFILNVVRKVQAGHGLDYYFTGEGVLFNYIGGLIAVALSVLAVVVGYGIRWWQKNRGTDE